MLNQPLNVIRMAAESTIESIEEDGLDEKFLTMKLSRISEQTQRAASIIDHMRVFGRKADEEFEVIDLRETVDKSLSFMSEQLRLREINLINEYSDDSCFVRGHSVQIEQVIINLLSNARDALAECANAHTAKTITVTIEVNREQRVVDLSIADTGGGIKADVIDRIFEPFYTTKQIGKGTGLGLSISYGIVTDMGGNMSAENGILGAVIKMGFPLVEKFGGGVSG